MQNLWINNFSNWTVLLTEFRCVLYALDFEIQFQASYALFKNHMDTTAHLIKTSETNLFVSNLFVYMLTTHSILKLVTRMDYLPVNKCWLWPAFDQSQAWKSHQHEWTSYVMQYIKGEGYFAEGVCVLFHYYNNG